jgi:hypothetical protein
MSTAQDVLNAVRHTINPDADVFGVLNSAIRSVAKRLFVLRSRILRSELSVSIFGEVTATGTDIAFVDSDPDTITSTSTDLSGFSSGQHITTGSSVNPGPFEINTAAENTLTLISTDELTAEAAGDSLTITSNDDYGDLPSDFWGLVDRPYLSGKTYPLKPLPNLATKLSYTGAGIPVYYEIKGKRIYVTPATGSDYTVVGDYFAKPTEITDVGDTLPFDEILDDVISEYMRVYFTTKPGGTVLIPDYLKSEIDLVAGARDKKAPYHIGGGSGNGGIDWEAW